MRWKIVVVAACALLGFVAIQPAEAAVPPSVRIEGADRYATAANVSKAAFQPGVDVVYVSTGEGFPDALAAGPVGAKANGPVLLVTTNLIPTSTATELDRLDPDKIVVLGGTASVSEGVLTSLDAYTEGTVTRLGGADRYETSALLSTSVFSPGVPVVYIASGVNYPDALAGAAAAGSQGGPVLLVRTESIPTSVETELNRLDPVQIVVLGGTATVSNSVQADLADFSSQVVRRGGTDRYKTAALVSGNAFTPDVQFAFITTGLNFPDALSAGPPAGIAKVPVLLVPGNCIPTEVQAEIDRLTLEGITILGGQTSVSASVAAGQSCTPGNGSGGTSGSDGGGTNGSS
jgi:putative cell wall-binding protein